MVGEEKGKPKSFIMANIQMWLRADVRLANEALSLLFSAIASKYRCWGSRRLLGASWSAAAPGVMQLWGFSQGFYLAEAHSLHPFSYLGPPKVALQTSASIFYNKTEVLCVHEWWLHSFISFLRNRRRKLVYRMGHLHFCCHISPCTWLCNRRL